MLAMQVLSANRSCKGVSGGSQSICGCARSLTQQIQSRALRLDLRPAISRPHGTTSRRCLTVAAAAAPAAKAGPNLDLAKMEPLGDRILVKPAEESTTSEGGLILSSSKPSPMGMQDAVIGEVLAVGSDIDIKVKKGDTIVYSKYSTSDVSVPDGDVTFVAQKSVLAILS